MISDLLNNNNPGVILTSALPFKLWWLFSPVVGVWLKATRSCRMREKRADFVAGCLGGRVIAAGGLGK